ncbi:hypothetical protein WA158_004013 [Blastocystis sp. Blastoise]
MSSIQHVLTGKLHILFNENDVLFHFTDDPGRHTYLRIQTSSKIKVQPDFSKKEAISSCINDLVNECFRQKMFEIICQAVTKDREQENIVNDIMQRLNSSGISCSKPKNKNPIPTARTRKTFKIKGRRLAS